MGRYLLNRLLLMILVILITSFLIYTAMNMTGGDPVLALAPDNASEAQLEMIREELGLNDPFVIRYFKYMGGMLKGDLGTSYVTKKDVFNTYIQRLPATMQLACASVSVAVLIAIPLGIYTAIRQNTWKDNLGMIFALFGVSMPNFWFGLMLMLLFSLKLGWLPSSGRNSLLSLILPAVTVGMGLAALKQYEMSILLITHDLGVVAEVCDEVAVIYSGIVVEKGSANEIFNHTRHPYTEGLFNSMPNLKQRGEDLEPIKGMMPDPMNLPEGCTFADRCPYVTARCQQVQPDLKLTGDTHFVACLAYDDKNFKLRRYQNGGK